MPSGRSSNASRRRRRTSAPPRALGLTVARGLHLYNCAALSIGGQILGIVPKEKLPTYNVFYEARVYARGVPWPARRGSMASPSATFARVRLRHDRLRGLRRLLVPGRPDAPSLVRRARRSSSISAPRPIASASSPDRREMLATRANDNQCNRRLHEPRRRERWLVFDGGAFRGPERPHHVPKRIVIAKASAP